MALLTRDNKIITRCPKVGKGLTAAEIAEVRKGIRPLGERVARVEQRFIESALILCEGDVTETAGRLNVSRSTLFRRIQEYRAQDEGANL